MARKQATQEPEAEEGGLRSQMWKHQLFVAWLKREHGVNLEQEDAASVIAWFAAKRNEFRKSEDYINAVNAHTEARDAAKAERAEARASKPKAEKAVKKTAKKAPAKKATGPTKTAKRGARKAAAAAAEDSPFA